MLADMFWRFRCADTLFRVRVGAVYVADVKLRKVDNHFEVDIYSRSIAGGYPGDQIGSLCYKIERSGRC